MELAALLRSRLGLRSQTSEFASQRTVQTKEPPDSGK